MSEETATVLVTGASRGIGAAIAEKFARAGYRLVVHYNQAKEAAEEVAHRCSQYSAEVITIQANIAMRTEVQRMQADLTGAGFIPNVLVNNAGIAHYGMLADLTDAEWDTIVNVNLKGVFLCSQLFMNPMIQQRFGRIINISSIWGSRGASCEVAYSTTKGGVDSFTKALAQELALTGVTVNAVAPGAVQTDMLNDLQAEEQRELAAVIPAGRIGKPFEVAELVHFLAQPAAGYITGQIIGVNGGWHT